MKALEEGEDPAVPGDRAGVQALLEEARDLSNVAAIVIMVTDTTYYHSQYSSRWSSQQLMLLSLCTMTFNYLILLKRFRSRKKKKGYLLQRAAAGHKSRRLSTHLLHCFINF